MSLSISTTTTDTVNLIAVEGELDLATVDHMVAELGQWARRGRHLVLDLSRLTFCDGIGLAAFQVLHMHATRAGGSLYLIEVPTDISRLMQRVGFDRLVPVSASRAPSIRPGRRCRVVAPPDLDVARVRRWCTDRVPEYVRSEFRISCEVADSCLTIHECFGPNWYPMAFARLRYNGLNGLWVLQSRERGRNFQTCEFLSPSAQVQDLLDYLDTDDSIFWG
ncbi:STAS domain-containing protein [Antrihabitans sp. YC3-6]|uniref:STAS domain-containing protein n=1 Tax=Antrihabitans stalagmiti TaxID=2799499 RepID=A0A934NU57_9NOCA|nr:STAS domain-containing protein [Antrihabitans stalagmiti]MBJ8341344.1 STAS domain-containing protein [Antrihabitans stalagmiti]